MLLIATATAYRGDNTRRLLLSDLYIRDIPMVDIGPGVKVMVRLCRMDKHDLTLIFLPRHLL